MKIVHIIGSLDVGGAEKVLVNLLENYPDKSVEHYVISMLEKRGLAQDIADLSIPVISLGMEKKSFSLFSLLKLRKIIRELSPNVIQGWMYHGNIMSTIAYFFNKKSLLFWAVHHSLSDLKGEKKFTRLLIKMGAFFSRFTDGVIYVSKVSARQHELIGYSSNRTKVIPNGVDLSKFCFTSGDSINSELGIPQNSSIVSIIARYHPVKDHATFFHAVAKVMRFKKNAHFILVGKGVTEKNIVIEKLRGALLYPDNVHLLGERRDIKNILLASTLLVNSSKSEAFPVTVAEAMACGVPCVVTDVGDSAYLLSQHGKVVPPEDGNALANAIVKMLSLSACSLSTMGDSARERVVEHFSMKLMVRAYYRLYQ